MHRYVLPLLLSVVFSQPLTAQTPALLKDIWFGPTGGISGQLVKGANGLYFTGNDFFTGWEPWFSDGTPAGTVLLLDVNPGSASSNPYLFIQAGGLMYFLADDGVNGSELWVSNGTPAGTHLVKDITPGPGGSSVSGIAALGDTLIFGMLDASGFELWMSDSTAAGTVMIKDINPGPAWSFPSNMRTIGGTVYFSADDGTNGAELWKTDGSAAGTVMVKDIRPGATGSGPAGLVDLNGVLVLSADDGAAGGELWRSDGTAIGTTILSDINPGGGGSTPSSVIVIGGALYFSADDGTAGFEPWTSDGTGPGTMLIKDIRPGSDASSPANFREAPIGVIFHAFDPASHFEPWITDGTPGGTMLLKDINPGAGASFPQGFTRYGDWTYFTASEPVNGRELWRTDGTPGGTNLVADLMPSSDGTPESYVVFGDTLFFIGTIPVAGREPLYLYVEPSTDTVTVDLNDKWNLVSVPVEPDDPSKGALFPTSTTDANAWEGGAYAVRDTLESGRGYFLKFTGAQSVELFGEELTVDTVNLDEGWNLIGSVTDPVAVSSVMTSPGVLLESRFYGYEGKYAAVATIEPGRGYWVKSSEAGYLVLDAAAMAPAAGTGGDEAGEIPGGLSSLTFTDAAGMEQTLWFGAGVESGGDRFLLPPLPPAGGFDVRFASGRSVELREPGVTIDLPIMITGAADPLRLRWNISGGSTSLITASGAIPLAGTGGTLIERPETPLVLRLAVQPAGADVPDRFALLGNYPNPFNPSTLIAYALPVESRVKLTIFDLLGREVAVLTDGIEGPGYRRVEWDAGAAAGGVFFFRLDAAAVDRPSLRFTAQGKMVLLR